MSETTIKVYEETKMELDKFREYKNESYDEVIRKLVHIVKTARKEPKLSKATIEAIDAARERYKKGIFFTEEQSMNDIGLMLILISLQRYHIFLHQVLWAVSLPCTSLIEHSIYPCSLAIPSFSILSNVASN